MAAYINSDDTFLIYRKFGRPINRVLLHLQEELTGLERDLDNLDNDDAENETLKPRLAGYEDYDGWDEKQRDLLLEIKTKWMEYGRP